MKVSIIKEDKWERRLLLELLKLKKIMEIMHDTKRLHGDPSMIIITIKCMELKLSFRKVFELRHIPSLAMLKEGF